MQANALLTLTAALKEWAVAVEALTQGKTILLLRKGGIREQNNAFTIPYRQVWLYPTYEHQKPHLLKPAYADQVSPVEAGWHPEAIALQSWADITHTFQVSDAAVVEALSPFHIWNQEFVTERLKWKPRTPLSVLLLRVYRLPQSQEISYQPEYGGCKSWIELCADLSPAVAEPVLSDADYQRRVDEILRVIYG